MKKIIAMLLVLVMLFALSAAAMADEAPAESEDSSLKFLSWISAWRGINQTDLTGKFYQLGDLEVDIWLPDVMTPQSEIPDDAFFVFADGTGNATIKAHRVDLEGATTLEEVEKMVIDDGCVSDGIYNINGFNALVFESKDNDSINVVMLRSDDDSGVEFVFKGVSNEDMHSLTTLVMASIQHHTLTIDDVAEMMGADLTNSWGDDFHLNYGPVEGSDKSNIIINLKKEGVNVDTIKSVTGWDSLKDDLTNLDALYINVLQNFHMDDIELIMNFTDENEESNIFMTIENGDVTFDYFAQ